MAENVSWKKIVKSESNYLGEWDLPVDHKPVVVTIRDAVQEVVTIPARSIIKNALVITFDELPKKFVCNSTNGARIEKALGTRILSEWVGKKIEIYVDDKVKFGSGLVSAIRVKPQAPAQDNIEYHCSVCGKTIAKDLYDKSIERYGKAYCSKECLDKDVKGDDVEEILGDK